jgi:hypothetical protein
MKQATSHPLEHNDTERGYFLDTLERSGPGALAAYRRAVEILTGGLPTWARRAKAGRKAKASMAV